MRTSWILACGMMLLCSVAGAAGPVAGKSAPAAKWAAKGKATTSSPMTPSPEADPIQQLAVAEQVHTGRMVCELGNFVSVTRDPQVPSKFVVQMRQHTFHMTPVVSDTGAVRLEDAQAGAMWLQLANKSMLMNSKIGQRMADDCQSPEQASVAQAMKVSPPPSLLDDPHHLAKK